MGEKAFEAAALAIIPVYLIGQPLLDVILR
jgi:hypothetical protein